MKTLFRFFAVFCAAVAMILSFSSCSKDSVTVKIGSYSDNMTFALRRRRTQQRLFSLIRKWSRMELPGRKSMFLRSCSGQSLGWRGRNCLETISKPTRNRDVENAEKKILSHLVTA